MKVRDLIETSFKDFDITLTDSDIVDGRMPEKYRSRVQIKDGIIQKDFIIERTRLTTLEGGPKEVGGKCQIEFNDGLESLKFAPDVLRKDGYFFGNPVMSLAGIGRDYLKEVRGKLFLPDTIQESILGVMIIKGLKNFEFDVDSENEEVNNPKLALAASCMFWIWETEGADVLEAQEYMISRGVKQFAKL